MNIIDLLKNPESKTLEFKRDLSSPDGVLRTLIAFANTSGGTLIIGIEDKSRDIRGVAEPLALEERLASIISDSIVPKIVPNIEIAPWRNTYLILIHVYPSNSRPHYLKSKGLERGVFIRVGSTNRMADTAFINELQRVMRSESYDEQPLPELNSEAINFRVASEFFSEYRKLKQSDLISLRLMTQYQGRQVPTVGGMLLFGDEREHYFPDAWIQAGRFQGLDKRTIVDTQEIHSLPIKAVDDAMSFMQKHLMQSIEISGIRRKEQWTVPLVALRETIINAIAHADYSQRGAPIRIAIFDNRIEIENPGIIPFNLTLEDIYQGISKLRNPVIGRVFHEVKIIERWGSGVKRIIEACQDARLEKPLFEEIGTHFRVTLFTTQTHVRKKSELDEIDSAILALLKNGEGLSTQQIANNIARSSRTIRTRLIKLIAQGLIVAVGSGAKDPKRKYYLA